MLEEYPLGEGSEKPDAPGGEEDYQLDSRPGKPKLRDAASNGSLESLTNSEISNVNLEDKARQGRLSGSAARESLGEMEGGPPVEVLWASLGTTRLLLLGRE